MKLRAYQQKIVDEVLNSFKNNYKSPVAVLGCGGGKSIIAADLAKKVTDFGYNVLFLVHRVEIKEQIEETFEKYGVNMKKCDISMVQSAKKCDKQYSLIITDEAHHSTATTYQNIYRRYPNAKRVNITATPCRTDGRGLGETCDVLIENVSVKWLIENQYLAPYEYYTFTLDSIDFEAMKKVRGEYEDITDLLIEPKIYGNVFEHYQIGKKAIVYCSSIKHSIKTAQEFNAKGIPSAHIDGDTPKEERKRITSDFKKGKIMVLCNFALISEGYDVPDCDMVILLRKTTSLGLFIQMVMRCMRFQPNKTAIILDFCGNAYEHGLPDDDREWNLNSKVKHARNPSSEPDVLVRTCKSCFRVYGGSKSICPYCNNDNGKTRREIKEEERAKLEKITEIKKKEEREELKKAQRSYETLVEYGKRKGYKPGWAWTKWQILERYRRR